MWKRCGRDVEEMWKRCGRDVEEMWKRCGRDVMKMRWSGSGEIEKIGRQEGLCQEVHWVHLGGNKRKREEWD
jgi:hypothetical protein